MKLNLISLGCDKNLVDSEKMLARLFTAGFEYAGDPEEADIIIVNSCAFIGDAKAESINTILEMAQYKETGRCKGLIVTGCLAERYKDEVLSEIPEVDAVIGTNAFQDVEKIAVRLFEANSKAFGKAQGAECKAAPEEESSEIAQNKTPGSSENADKASEKAEKSADKSGEQEKTAKTDGVLDFKDLSRPYFSEQSAKGRVVTTGGWYCYLKIAEGCNKRCTYCIIPYLRGPQRSVPMEEIIKEAESLAGDGVKEFILVAQETTVYGTDLYGEKKLPELLRRLSEIEGIEWIRLLYCYPEEITDELIAAMKELPKVCHYLDIPIQHASDRILKRMARKTTEAEIRERIGSLRKAMPDIALRTTMITGFPGETDEDFEILYSFVNDMGFDRLGVFAYSKEEGTKAATFSRQVSKKVKEERRERLMLLQQGIAFEKAKEKIGKRFKVMIEGRLTEDAFYGYELQESELDAGDNIYIGRTYMDAPDVDGYVFVNAPERGFICGDMAEVEVTGACGYDLTGKIV